MTRAYKITRLPDGYCKVAVAAWKALGDRELFEIEGRLVFTDDLESYMEGGDRTAFCADEFDSHAAFEKWLLNAVAEWYVAPTAAEIAGLAQAAHDYVMLFA